MIDGEWRSMTRLADSNRCSVCQRGREACQYCENVTEQDWRAMCDCGLHDFGAHLFDCLRRQGYRWVIAIDHASAEVAKEHAA